MIMLRQYSACVYPGLWQVHKNIFCFFVHITHGLYFKLLKVNRFWNNSFNSPNWFTALFNKIVVVYHKPKSRVTYYAGTEGKKACPVGSRLIHWDWGCVDEMNNSFCQVVK